MDTKKFRVLAQYAVILVFVIASSYFVSTSWVQPKEEVPERMELSVTSEMTIKEFAAVNKLPDNIVGKAFGLKSSDEFSKKVDEFGLSKEALTIKVDKARAIEAEYESKNWKKILAKFVLWSVFLVVLFILIRKNSTSPNQRRFLYLISTIVFGIILGAVQELAFRSNHSKKDKGLTHFK